jgi:putative transposase
MAQAMGRIHFRYANYFQARMRRSGHLWQNRFYSCRMSNSHLVNTMLYFERNPVRAGLAAEAAQGRQVQRTAPCW